MYVKKGYKGGVLNNGVFGFVSKTENATSYMSEEK